MKKILVVDDDPDGRLYVSAILQQRGYSVTAVETGCEALSVMRKEFFDLVILDILLPDTTGLDLCMRIKEMNVNTLPVILISSVTDEAIWRQGLKRGADAFIAKPPSAVELIGRTVGLLEKAESAVARA